VERDEVGRYIASASEASPNGNIFKRLPATNSAQCRPTTEQEALRSGCNHVVQWVCLVEAHVTATPAPPPQILGLRKRSQWQAAHMWPPCNSAVPEASVVNPNHTSTSRLTRHPLIRVSHFKGDSWHSPGPFYHGLYWVYTLFSLNIPFQ